MGQIPNFWWQRFIWFDPSQVTFLDMDDSIDSVETVQHGIQLYKELDSLWGIAGMQARKWVSNSLYVVAATPEADRAAELQITEEQQPVVKTTGII